MKKIFNLKNEKKLAIEVTRNSTKEMTKGLVGWIVFISLILYYIKK